MTQRSAVSRISWPENSRVQQNISTGIVPFRSANCLIIVLMIFWRAQERKACLCYQNVTFNFSQLSRQVLVHRKMCKSECVDTLIKNNFWHILNTMFAEIGASWVYCLGLLTWSWLHPANLWMIVVHKRRLPSVEHRGSNWVRFSSGWEYGCISPHKLYSEYPGVPLSWNGRRFQLPFCREKKFEQQRVGTWRQHVN
jgi:hypothetical protein